MQRRQPLPRLWLMTDERMGEALWTALARLPRGSGIVFRHYSLAGRPRAELLRQVRAVARRRRLVLLIAGEAPLRADGLHNAPAGRRSPGLRSASAHNLREVRAAERAGADLLFLSPVFPTRSHPGRRALGRVRFAALAREATLPVIALGGMNEKGARRLRGAYGWAGIDAWTG